MEENINPWKTNLANGLIFGLVGIAYSLVIYFLDLTFNKVQNPVFLLIQAIILFYLLKSYRDNYLHGRMTFGQSFGAGLIIYLYFALIMAVYLYILYTVIDAGLIDKQLAFAEDLLVKKGMPQSAIDTGMAFQRKIMKPGIMAPISIFGNMLYGAVICLLVSIFVRKEGNPLIDTPEN
jgi:hypothetical protein